MGGGRFLVGGLTGGKKDLDTFSKPAKGEGARVPLLRERGGRGKKRSVADIGDGFKYWYRRGRGWLPVHGLRPLQESSVALSRGKGGVVADCSREKGRYDSS